MTSTSTDAPTTRRDQGRWQPMDRAARVGLAGKGLFHLVLGALIVRLAFGDTASAPSGRGAMDALTAMPLGRPLVGAMAVGLAGYAVWRGRQAFRGSEGGSSLPEPLLRAAFAARALIYAGLAGLAVQEVLTGGTSGGGGQQERQVTRRLLEAPGGVVLVVAVGLVIVGVGITLAVRGIRQHPLEALARDRMPALLRWLSAPVAVVGLAGRAITYTLAGGFLVHAALTPGSGDQGVGLDGALRQVAESGFGTPVLLGAGTGLIVFAGLCALQTAYGRVRQMD